MYFNEGIEDSELITWHHSFVRYFEFIPKLLDNRKRYWHVPHFIRSEEKNPGPWSTGFMTRSEGKQLCEEIQVLGSQDDAKNLQ